MPQVVQISGHSMAPTLLPGYQVLVDLEATPRIGDVAAISGSNGMIIHRLVHSCSIAGSCLVFHCGDHGGGIGLCPATSIIGKVTSVLRPDCLTVPATAELPRGIQRHLYLARRRCQLYAVLRSLASRPPRSGMAQRFARVLRRALLRER